MVLNCNALEQAALPGFLLLPHLIPLCGRTEVASTVDEEEQDLDVRKSGRKRKPTEKVAALAAKRIKSRKSTTADTSRSLILIKPVNTYYLFMHKLKHYAFINRKPYTCNLE